jgi:hypothetical protein
MKPKKASRGGDFKEDQDTYRVVEPMMMMMMMIKWPA